MPQQPAFNVGDIVKLKSGGPDMTVQIVPEKSENYRCQWFAGKKLEFGFFQFESLKPVEAEQ
ncbi:YodC family protein [Pseudomonas sp. P9_31]|uniref:YodC family protein n=1 Tax=Pseudomonas sp. P9_31 TaxID=3043448 RepID=UPI002A35D2DA|nr:DUF2158 domain-containing protein [Pseudomonas sp. P9_31]WPN59740.1 DUF2158 domain-containing protein [Pseudomonas sp. P9_31]